MVTQVPNGLDDPPRFLFWNFDVVFIAVTGIFVGALLNAILLGVGFGMVMALLWQRFITRHGRGYAKALLYWSVGGVALHRLPPSENRRLRG